MWDKEMCKQQSLKKIKSPMISSVDAVVKSKSKISFEQQQNPELTVQQRFFIYPSPLFICDLSFKWSGGNTYSGSILNLHSFLSWLFWPWYSYSEETTRREYNNSQRLRTQTSSVSPSHSEITWNIWTIYTPRFSPIHLFVCVYCAMFWCFLLFIILRRTDAGFTFFLWSTLEKPTHNHLLISAQIPAPPAAWMFFFLLLIYIFSPLFAGS